MIGINRFPILAIHWVFSKNWQIEKGAILKEKEVVRQAKELVPLLIREISP
jgi:hypothetical protein